MSDPHTPSVILTKGRIQSRKRLWFWIPNQARDDECRDQPRPSRRAHVFELLRFYQAALVNTAFGFALFALLVWLGLGRYPAQFVTQVGGTAFNYLTYSRHVFRDRRGSPWRFVLAYGATYALNLGLLALLSLWIASPYVAGLLATLAASIVNYVVLKLAVFGRDAQPA